MMHPTKFGECIYRLALKYAQNLGGKSPREARLLQPAYSYYRAVRARRINLDRKRIIKRRILPFAAKPLLPTAKLDFHDEGSFYMQNMGLSVPPVWTRALIRPIADKKASAPRIYHRRCSFPCQRVSVSQQQCNFAV